MHQAQSHGIIDMAYKTVNFIEFRFMSHYFNNQYIFWGIVSPKIGPSATLHIYPAQVDMICRYLVNLIHAGQIF